MLEWSKKKVNPHKILIAFFCLLIIILFSLLSGYSNYSSDTGYSLANQNEIYKVFSSAMIAESLVKKSGSINLLLFTFIITFSFSIFAVLLIKIIDTLVLIFVAFSENFPFRPFIQKAQAFSLHPRK